MPEVPSLSPELSRSVSALARALVAAARTRTLYPAEHPAVRQAVERFGNCIEDACQDRRVSFGVTPGTLLVEGGPPINDNDGPVNEAAAWLHGRDIVRLTFRPGAPPGVHQAFLTLLAEDPRAVRQRGGPAKIWQETGDPSILIEQLDFSKILEDAAADSPVRRKDELWRSIVRAVLDRRSTLDEASQKRMLEIAGDVFAIGDLGRDVMAPNCTPDGSPLLTSQAEAILAAYRHLVGVVDVMAPDRRDQLLRNLASATAAMDPNVVLQILAAPDVAAGPSRQDLDLRRALAEAMDDTQVAQLLATTLALDGQATDRIVSVFGTIAPDDDRRRRVLTMTRHMLSESSFGSTTRFETLWKSMEELLLSYNERPFVSAQYGEGLDTVGARAERMAARDVPPELAALIATLDHENVRRLSVVLLIDLLAMERDAARAPELAMDVATLGEDLLLAGDYESTRSVVCALAAHAEDHKGVTSAGAGIALNAFIETSTFHEAVDDLGAMDDETASVFAAICAACGPAAADALRHLLDVEADTPARRRASRIVKGFGPRAVTRLAPLIRSPHWYTQRNAAVILGEIAAPDGVPLLLPLLRGGDPRVARAAVTALAAIDDPSAGRAVHTVLRTATGETRQAVIAALVAERDRRVVPLLARILDESDALGADHAVVLEALGAVGTLGGDQAVPAVERVMHKTRWFARAKLRALKTAAVQALGQIGSPAAAAAITRASARSDRMLKRTIARAGGA